MTTIINKRPGDDFVEINKERQSFDVAEQCAFEDWLIEARPHGDVYLVQDAWMRSHERACWIEEYYRFIEEKRLRPQPKSWGKRSPNGENMATLKKLFDALHESIELSTPNEIKSACELIIDVQGMNSGERDCIIAAYKNGPLFDGDIPCKSGRNSLIEKGYMAKVVVRSQDGYNACTNKGAWAYRIIQACIEA